MSENVKNDQSIENGLNDQLAKMFADYEKSKSGTGTSSSKLSKDELLKKYFIPRNQSETFRALPPLKGREYVESAYFHVVKVNTSKGKVYAKLYCPRHNNPKQPKLDSQGNVMTDVEGKPIMVFAYCPICEYYDKQLAKQDQSVRFKKKADCNDKELVIYNKNIEILKEASPWEAKKFYIMKGVDKGSLKDGVKFWRFKHNYKKTGVYDKLMPAINKFIKSHKVDYTSPEMGCDFDITVEEQNFPGSNRTYKEVTSILPSSPSKLTEDKILEAQWLNDKLIWRDVFKPRKAPGLTPEEYLARVVKGTDPYFDEETKKWVFPDPADRELEEKANTKDMSLLDNANKNISFASDVDSVDLSQYNYSTNKQTVDATSISSLSENIGEDLETDEESGEDSDEETNKNVSESESDYDNILDDGDIDDLPF